MAVILKSVGSEKVQVIKVFREVSGLDLKEAKGAVESIGTTPAVVVPLNGVSEDYAIAMFQKVGAVAVKSNSGFGTSSVMAEAMAYAVEGSQTVTNVADSFTESHASERMEEPSPVSNDIEQSAEGHKVYKIAENSGTLGREETLNCLYEVGETAKLYQELCIQLNELSARIRVEQQNAEALKSQISPEADSEIKKIRLLSLLVGISGFWFMFIPPIIAFIFYSSKKKKIIAADLELHKADNEAKAASYYAQYVTPLEEESAATKNRLKMELLSNGRLEWAIDFVGKDMFEYQTIMELYEIIKSRRADNLKEALNTYDSAQHRARMEEMQAATQHLNELQLDEAQKQSANLQEIQNASDRIAYYERQQAKAQKSIARTARRMEWQNRK